MDKCTGHSCVTEIMLIKVFDTMQIIETNLNKWQMAPSLSFLAFTILSHWEHQLEFSFSQKALYHFANIYLLEHPPPPHTHTHIHKTNVFWVILESVCLSVHPCICVSLYLCTCVSVCLPVILCRELLLQFPCFCIEILLIH